jgi:hypothetical protein
MDPDIKKLLILFLFASALPAHGQNNRVGFVSPEKLGEVLSCLQTKIASIGGAPPRAGSGFYRARYYYGVLTAGDDKPNELQLVVYAPKESSAILYRVYFDTENGAKEIFIGDWSTLKNEHGGMVPDEIPGGVATYYHIKKLLSVVSHRPAVTIPDSLVKTGPEACVFQP